MSLSVRTIRIELLVLSDLTATPETPYTVLDVRAAFRRVLQQRHGSVHAAIIDAAGELGDHPDVFVVRFRWASGVIANVYPPRPAPRQRARSTVNSIRVITTVGA